jgi:hypothetical protein
MHAEALCHKWLSTVLPRMHRRRLSALSAVVSGACRGGRLSVTGLGRSICSGAKTKHNIKRADRLFSNTHLQSERVEVYTRLSHQVLGAIKQPTIIVDWSDIDGRREFFLLRAAVAVKGRSLTLYEEVHTRETREKRKTHRGFLKNFKKILPPDCIPTIVTDAGFRTPWFKQVLALRWNYVGRIRNREMVQVAQDECWIGAKSLYVDATNKPYLIENVLLTQSNPLRCSLVLFKAKAKGRVRLTKMGKRARSRKSLVNAARGQEPWLLATSLSHSPAKTIVEIYATRMQIEESFRDLKCHRFGLNLYHNGTYKLPRMKLLVLIGAIATTFAWLLGMTARDHNLHQQFQANTTFAVSVLSNVFIGIQIFRYQLLKIPWTDFIHTKSLIIPANYFSALHGSRT